jgi:hypothetical protein
LDIGGQLHAQTVHAADGEFAGVESALAEAAQNHAEHDPIGRHGDGRQQQPCELAGVAELGV